jgi:autotransporter-associated beta strand protein
LVLAGGTTRAATWMWDGGPAGTLTELGTSTTAQWSPDGTPNVNGDTLQWNGLVPGSLVLSYTSGLGGAAGNTGLNLNLTTNQTGALTIDTGASTASLRLDHVTIVAGAGAFTLGNGLNTFNITLGGGAGTRVWSNHSLSTATVNADVVFGSGGAANQTFIFDGGGNWTLNNKLYFSNGGVLTLIKSGAGTLTLAATNTYTGSTTVSNGTLVLQGGYASPAFNILSNAVLELNVASGSRDCAAAVFSGAGTLRKTGAGQMVWGAAAASFTLGSGSLIDVQGGTFVAGSSANENWATSRSDLNIAPGATFKTVEANVRLNRLTGGGILGTGYSGAGYQNLTLGLDDGSSTFNGVIQNTDNNPAYVGNLAKVGSGTITLNGTNTYTGTTTVSAGTLVIGGSLQSRWLTVYSNAVLQVNAPGLAPTSWLSLSTGSTLNLAHGGTNLIGRLYVNGQPMAAGLWGAPGSGAPNTSPLLTGTGKLAVTGGLLLVEPAELANLTNGGWSVEWNSAGNFEGWSSSQVTSASVSGGVLSGTASGAAPSVQVTNLRSADLDLGFNDYLELRLQLPAGYSGPVFIDYGTTNSVTSTGSPGLSSSRRLVIPAGVVQSDGAFHTYQLDVSLEQQWRHRLHDLRVYPLGTNATAGQSFAIDYVRVGDVGRVPVQDGWMDSTGGMPYRVSSKHFVFGWNDQVITDVGMNTNWAHGNLRNAEECWSVYVKKLGYTPPQNNAFNKVNFTCIYSGNFGGGPMFQISRYELRIDPPTWTTPHELMHVFQGAANGGNVPGDFGEMHANYGRERWLQHYQNLFPGETGFARSIRSEMHLHQPIGRNYYETWPFYLYCDLNPDSLPDIGEGTVVKLWRQMAAGEVNYSTLERLTPNSSVKDIIGLYARRGLTLNYPGTVLRTTIGSSIDTWGQLTEPVRRPDDPTWFQVPTERAPQQGAFTIHELTPAGSGAGRVVSVNFRGLGYGSGLGADWRASFIVIADDNSERYSTLWNQGTNSVTLAANENRVYLSVAATPDNYRQAGFIEYDQPFRSDISKRRYPYEFQVTGATPKESNNGTTSGGWVVHSNGGGLKAATASVASTVYVGPTARVEDSATVTGSSQIRDNAVVRGHASVNNSTISGNAIVGDYAFVEDSTVTGNARVFEHGRMWSSTTVSDQAVVKGSALCWGGNITGNAIVDGDYGFNRNVNNAEVSGHWPWVGVPDSFLNPLPTLLFAAYDLNTNDALLTLDTYSPGEALLRGSPGWVASDAGRSGVQTFNGSNQWVQLPRAVAELRELTIATTVKWAGGADNQTLFLFGDGAAKYITFTPRNSSGLAELKVSNGTSTYSVTAPALTPGVWTQVGIALDGTAASINYNGVIAGVGTVPVQPQQVLPPNTRDNPAHNYLGRGATSFFNGAVDSFRVYSSAVPSGLLVKVEPLPASILETAGSTTLRFSRLALNGSATNGALTLNYTVSGTATVGLDYVALPGSVTIPAGQSYVDVALSVLPDAVTESNETIVITLAAPAGYALVEGGTTTVTLVDAPPLSASLLAWYKLDETSGTDAADSSGNNNTATLYNGPVWGTVGGQPALTFDGADDYVQTPVPSGGTRTLSAWIRPHTAMNSSLIYSVFDSDVPGAYGTGWGVANGQIRVILEDQFWDTGISVTLNQWQHGTLAFDATQARFYTNGVLAATLNYFQGSVGTTAYKIGRSHANPLTFDGDLRDARIYNRALYGGEVQQIFQTPLPWTPPLVSAMPNDQAVLLSWQPAYLADSYAVERSLTHGGPYAPLDTTTDTTFTDTGLTNSVTYYYVVRGVNSSGNGPASVEVSATPQVIPAPGNGVWNNLAGGSWTNWGNWVSNTVAAGTDKKATFALGSPVTVSLDANRTVGFLAFSNANHTIAGTSTLTLDVTSGAPVISVESNRTAAIQPPVTGADGLLKSGPGTLVLAGANTITGTGTVTNGTIVLQSTYASTSFAIATNAVLELNTATGDKDYGNATFSGTGTLRKTGARKAVWGSSVATFALGSGSVIDVQGGTLVGGSYGNENWTGNKADLNVAAGAIFEGVEANVRVDALSGAGVIQSGYSGAGYSAFTFGVDNGSGEFSGVLADNYAPGNFIKTGTGTQTLSGVNLYSGVTTLAGGVLNIAQFSNYGYPGGLGLRASDSGGNVGLLFRGGTLQYTGAVPQSTDRAIRISTTGGATLDASGSQPSATLRFTAASSPDFFENSGARTLTLTGSNPGENTFAMTIAETGGATSLIKNGPGKWVLTGNNTYTGATTVNAGVLWIHGTNAGSAITVTNATLGGTGLIKGPVTVQTGATLAPGASIGTLTVSNTLTLAAGSQTVMEINAATGTNDQVRGLTTVNYGGTLVVTNLAGTASAGQSFQLFSAASRTGNFSSISPTNAGAGLVWNFNPTNGVLTALATVALNPTNVTASVSGTNLTLSWPADHTGWTLLSQTNHLNMGLSANTNDWMRLPGSSATNSVVIPILPTQPGGYYRLVYP